MGATDAPLFGIEIVGTGAKVIHQAKTLAAEADLNDAARSIGREDEGLALEVAEGVGEGEVDAGEKNYPSPIP